MPIALLNLVHLIHIFGNQESGEVVSEQRLRHHADRYQPHHHHPDEPEWRLAEVMPKGSKWLPVYKCDRPDLHPRQNGNCQNDSRLERYYCVQAEMNVIVSTGLGASKISWGNMGDISMLQTCVTRLERIWPEANLNVITEWPDELKKFCPNAVALPAAGRNIWIGEDLLMGGFIKFVPEVAKRWAVASKKTAGLHFPRALRRGLTAGLTLQRRTTRRHAVDLFSRTLACSDAVVVTGAGGFFNGCREWNMVTLDLLEAAVVRRIPAAMFGQHFGPLTDADVLSRCRRILPQIDLIALRGHSDAKGFLESLGVVPSRIYLTGDEAIEMAHEVRPQKLGAHLGLNFRLRASVQSDESDIELVRPALRRFSQQYGITLLPVPIAVDAETSDYGAIKQVLKGIDDHSDGGARLASPGEVMKQAGRCRVLVTCAYHAAVFALSQGVPVIALAKSSYFVDKFLGLKERFGLGCEVICFDRPKISEDLYQSLETTWQKADDLHPLILASALSQIQSGREAYGRFRDLVSERGSARSMVNRQGN